LEKYSLCDQRAHIASALSLASHLRIDAMAFRSEEMERSGESFEILLQKKQHSQKEEQRVRFEGSRTREVVAHGCQTRFAISNFLDDPQLVPHRVRSHRSRCDNFQLSERHFHQLFATISAEILGFVFNLIFVDHIGRKPTLLLG
jgi:hypothetical protein